jgi:SAM-dependent methyltransferase
MSMNHQSAEGREARLARYYDLDFLDVTYDAELYLELARDAPGPVLELGVGSGRLAVPLALAGHPVLGIDTDMAMLDRAAHRWETARGRLPRARFETALGDFYRFRSRRRFGLAFLAVNTFLLAEDDKARVAVLSTMRDHLLPGGTAAIEIGTPDARELARYDRRVLHEWLRYDPVAHEMVSKSMVAEHDPDLDTLELTQIFEWTAREGGVLSRVTRTDLLHLISADQLARLAREAGFSEVDVRGDHLAIPHHHGSQRAILVARLV